MLDDGRYCPAVAFRGALVIVAPSGCQVPVRPGLKQRPRKGVRMALLVHAPQPRRPDADRLAYAREIIRAEAAALEQVAGRLDASFLEAVDLFHRCAGRVAVTGTGKSADV